MEQRFGVNVATTWGWSLAECVDAWVRKGVPAIGLGAQIIDAHGRAEGVKLLRDSGLRVSAFTTISPASMDAGTIESTLDLAAAVGADCVYVITGGRKVPAWRAAVDIFKEEFGPSREMARERGVRLAIEPMHPLRQDLSFLNTARDAGRVVAEIGDPNVGYVFDFWHLWWTPAILQAIAETAPRIFSVQVSDHKPMTMRSLHRPRRGADSLCRPNAGARGGGLRPLLRGRGHHRRPPRDGVRGGAGPSGRELGAALGADDGRVMGTSESLRKGLRQRVDDAGGLLTFPALPSFPQLVQMERCPLNHETVRSRGEMSMEHSEAADSDYGLLSLISRVKVRRCVVGVIHADDDSVEPGELRHWSSSRARRA